MSPLFTLHVFGRAIPITLWTCFGLIGNILFTLRILVQWIASERRGRSVVPVSFWWMSFAASLIMITYAFGRHDIPFVLGLAVTLVPYTRNLIIHYRPEHPPLKLGWLLPLAIALACVPEILFFRKEAVRDGWFWFGLLANAIFGSRFFVQWMQSEARRESVLSLSFWYLSLVGGSMMLVYGVARNDAVIILAFLFTVIPYGRNLVLLHRHHRLNGRA